MADVQAELEDLTEDEDEIQQQSPRKIEIWRIKKKIKISFKTSEEAPTTDLAYYKIGRIIGRGSFGKVNIGLHKLTRKIVAIKSFDKQSLANKKKEEGLTNIENIDNLEQEIQKIEAEFQILSRLRHRNVVKFFEQIVTETHLLFFMELCQGGDLLSYVRHRRKVPEPVAKYLFRQLIIGIGYIHAKDIVHRDIKLENILIDNEGVVKIADFGVSEVLVEEDGKNKKIKDAGTAGTRAYKAPEMIP